MARFTSRKYGTLGGPGSAASAAFSVGPYQTDSPSEAAMFAERLDAGKGADMTEIVSLDPEYMEPRREKRSEFMRRHGLSESGTQRSGTGGRSAAEHGQRVRDGRYKAAINRATRLGQEHGRSAGSWVIDGNSDDATIDAIMRGYDEGDPEIMDIQPSPLSGEWADGLLPRDVLSQLGLSEDSNMAPDVLDAFEAGYSDGFWEEALDSGRRMGNGPYAQQARMGRGEA